MKNAMIGLVLILTTSCGVKTNQRPLVFQSDAIFEQKCLSNGNVDKVTEELGKIYNDFTTKSPMSYYVIPNQNYDYKNPLVIGLRQLKANLKKIQDEISDDTYLQANYTTVALDAYFNYQNALRFESKKCAFKQLIAQKSLDITPYMSMKDFCLKKNSEEMCNVEMLFNLSPNESFLVQNDTILMCRSLTGNSPSCSANYSPSLTVNYQKQFKTKKFDKLFSLKESHLKFICEKNEDITTMKVKVLKGGIDIDKLKFLTAYIAKAWTNSNFIISIELTDNKTDDVIEIIPTTRVVSYVQSDNFRKIYLSTIMDNMTAAKVIAHEFGHVLGFPDCYTEFYDTEKKSLIYYEISKENTNIMCSMKNGVTVPVDYLDQLAQKSCLFN
ncbi:MAG: hypothetical protein H7336_03580 [Bacteriovorax sp.]|nr:hypothetical protein [Bacteriovorax sp.]